MAFSLPKISITIKNSYCDSRGVMGMLSIGFGVFLAWFFSTMLGEGKPFSSEFLPSVPDSPAGALTYLYIVFTAAFVLTMLFVSITDQRLLHFYTSKRAILGCTLLCVSGTLAIFGCFASSGMGLFWMILSGILCGIGGAGFLLLWGVAFSRCDSTTIVMNASFGVVLGVAIYLIVELLIPAPYAGLVAAILPLLELPMLWKRTPTSYAIRHAVPIFNPLPVRKATFALQFGLPVLLLGFSLGVMRCLSIQIISNSGDVVYVLLSLFAGGAASIVLLITTFSLDKNRHWEFLFRPIIPIVICTMFFIPSLVQQQSALSFFVIMFGYMSLEALMWIFFGELCQEFRPSPLFVFSLGCGSIAIGSLLGSLAAVYPNAIDSISPFGSFGGVTLFVLVTIVAYAVLPRARDIKRVIAPQQSVRRAEINWDETAKASDRQPSLDIPSNLRTFPLISDGDLEARIAALSMSVPQLIAKDAEHIPSAQPASDDISEEAGAEASEVDEGQKHTSGRFRTQCEDIANKYLLSRRETEVMFLLARGHNAAFIQEKLCISRSTAKTHISHIYRKLDIHNQQELLKMVDETRN